MQSRTPGAEHDDALDPADHGPGGERPLRRTAPEFSRELQREPRDAQEAADETARREFFHEHHHGEEPDAEPAGRAVHRLCARGGEVLGGPTAVTAITR